MQPLTQQGQQRINDIANQFNISTDAVLNVLQGLINGNGSMSQFSHPDLGGSGQWMQGGMTMVGDMFNHSLKSKVDSLCFELSNLLAQQPFRSTPSSFQSQTQGNGQQQGFGNQQQQGGGSQQQSQGGGYNNSNSGYGNSSPVSLFVPGSSGNWWPGDLGSPSSTGAQNNVKYAYFPGSRRLAVNINGEISIYDTLDHQIGGVSQQQGYGASVIFTSQYGTVDVLSLPIISGPGTLRNSPKPNSPSTSNPAVESNNSSQAEDIIAKIEKLAQLKEKGILSEEEFKTKKAELLSRI